MHKILKLIRKWYLVPYIAWIRWTGFSYKRNTHANIYKEIQVMIFFVKMMSMMINMEKWVWKSMKKKSLPILKYATKDERT